MPNDKINKLVNNLIPKITKNNEPAIIKKDTNNDKTLLVFIKNGITLVITKDKTNTIYFEQLAYNKTYSLVEIIDKNSYIKIETPDNTFIIREEVEPDIYKQILDDFVFVVNNF